MSKLMIDGVCYGSNDANDIIYDNSKSGLDSTNAKGAIDELAVSINHLQTSFQDGCSVIANAITEMGVTTANNASPNVMANNIRNIRTGITLTDYTINLYCAKSNKYEDDIDGVQRNSSSSFKLNVTDYKTLYIGSYTMTTGSSHADGKPVAVLTCNVDGVSTTLDKNGTTIDVSNASTVSITGKFTSNTGASYNVNGTIIVSEIIIS